jgi:hypothetical protein
LVVQLHITSSFWMFCSDTCSVKIESEKAGNWSLFKRANPKLFENLFSDKDFRNIKQKWCFWTNWLWEWISGSWTFQYSEPFFDSRFFKFFG